MSHHSELPDYRHRAWMNGRKFTRNGKIFTVDEGCYNWIDGEHVPTIKFSSGDEKFEMSEAMFFDKVNEL